VRPDSQLALRALSLHRSSRKRPFRFRLPTPFVSARIRCLPAICPKTPVGPSLGCIVARVAPFDRCGLRRSSLTPTPSLGLPLPRASTLDCVLPLPWAGLPGTNRSVTESIRLALPTRPALACPIVRVCRLRTDRFRDSARRLRGRFIVSAACLSATRTRY
jgi:hypothetical protein